ncbi:hypothetical protein [Saccharospirillum impatiens]|uniref:hypothetical protein n=1 Tax=Saccharospirillum impatiens TaxID=169438 RepID=UPI00041A2C21|nr:hypothetical protein [Saccharospirillum impatiens]
MTGYSIKAMNGQSTTVTNGDLQLQVQSGAAIHQINGNIHIQGNGNGDILLKQGDGGVKIDPSGNIKLFGKKVTLNGQNGVIFNGEVHYEVGAGNEPEEGPAINTPEIPRTESLELDGIPPVEVSPHAYERDTRAHDENAREWVSLAVTDEANQPIPHADVVVTREDGTEILARADEQGYLRLQKDGLKGATAEVLYHSIKE